MNDSSDGENPEVRSFMEERRHKPGLVIVRHLSGPPLDYTLVRWHKKVGDPIDVSEAIATIETASFTWEVEVNEKGFVSELLFAPGSSIPDSAILARIKPNDEKA